MRLRPDDEVYRVRAVWLGPQGATLPWVARYLAYGVFLVIFLVILLFELVTPLDVGVPPVWEICIAIFATYLVMGAIDHDRPLRSLVENVVTEVTSPRPGSRSRVRVAVDRVRVRDSKGTSS